MAEATVEAARSPYKPVTPAIVDELKSIVGEPYVIFSDAERMADFAHDEVPGEEYVHMPEVVVRAESRQDLSGVAAFIDGPARAFFPESWKSWSCA